MTGEELQKQLDGKVNQMFTVPNNEEGRLFIALAKKYLNSDSYQLRQRGRTPNKAKAKKAKYRLGYQSTPLAFSDNIGVYLMAKMPGGVQVVGIKSLIYERYFQGEAYKAQQTMGAFDHINVHLQNLAKLSAQMMAGIKGVK
jgi:hypothetical protein